MRTMTSRTLKGTNLGWMNLGGRILILTAAIAVLLSAGLLAPTAADAATYYSTINGTWGTAATWSTTTCGGTGAASAPTAADDAVICNGDTVTLEANKTIVNLTINSGGVLSQTRFGTDYTLTVTGNYTNNGTHSGGTNAAMTFNGTNTTLDGAGNVTNTGTLTITNNKNIVSSATLTFSGPVTLSANTNADNNGGLIYLTSTNGLVGTDATSVWTNDVGGSLSVNGPLLATGTLNATAAPNTVSYSGAAQTVKPTTYFNLVLIGSGVKTLTGVSAINGALTLGGTASATLTAATTVGDAVNIGAGTTLASGNYALNVGGDWANSGGTFTAGTGTVTFNAANSQNIYSTATSTWYNLVVTGAPGKTMAFQDGVLQAVTNRISLNGAPGQLLMLASVNPGAQWMLHSSATQSVNYVMVSDSDASGGSTVLANNGTSMDGGNNINWKFYPNPTVTSTSPNTGGQGAASRDVLITGTNIYSGATATFSGTGITINSTTWISSTQLSVNIAIASGATVGARNVTVVNSDGGSGTGTNVFTITAAPTVTACNPNTRGTGATNQNITITGTNFQPGAVADFGTLITVNLTSYNTSTSLTTNIDIDNFASTGPRAVQVTNPDGGMYSATTFTVSGITVTSLSPSAMATGTTGTVTVNGTGFAAGATVVFSGTGITINRVGTITATAIPVNITIASNAQTGLRDVTVTNTAANGAGVATGVGKFAVTGPAPTVTSVSPGTGNQGANNMTLTITGTNFQDGVYSTVSGTGITVTSTTYVSPTQLTAVISIATNALTTARSITVYNPDTLTATGGTFTVSGSAVCSRIAPTVAVDPLGTVYTGGYKIYTVRVTNNDSSQCTSSTFSLAISSETGGTSSFIVPSLLGSTSTGALAPGTGIYVTTLKVQAQVAATTWAQLTTTLTATDGNHTGGLAGTDSVQTTVSGSPLMHNGANVLARGSQNLYWNGTWGTPGGKYGEFTCATCHDKNTAGNIKRIKTSISTPDGTNWASSNSPSVVVSFQSTSSTANGFGDDQNSHATSTKVCEVCHSQQPFHKYTETRVNLHENTSTTPANYQDCVQCHLHKNGFALPGCVDCHAERQGNRDAVVNQFSANSHHVQGVQLTNKHCYQCHWEANADGSMNSTYHLGWRNGLPGIGGAPIQLVIWNGGSRPTVYGATTATAYTANGSRTEMAKLNAVCLGCHNNTNLATQPFDDGRRTSQYAWDGTSVDARYSQAGSTTFGKYSNTTTYPNAAPKNIAKAYSAHGNAVTNARGWSTTTGVDGTIPNTGGTQNVLCFDCHNAHGSTVVGTTTSYANPATVNGAMLKDTTDGLGGYSITYQPQASDGTGARVADNPGADLCFDCHMTQTGGVSTPWGYNSTFGATQPIISYWEKPGWKGAAGTNPAGAQVRYPFKNNIGTSGGHFGASSDLNTTTMGTINGLCTPCHDPHGVSPVAVGTCSDTTQYTKAGCDSVSASWTPNQAYGVPMLKGTWVTSPYKEDAAPANTNEPRGGGRRQNPVNVGSTPGYHLDQNTLGATALPTNQPYTWSFYTLTTAGARSIVEKDNLFAGLCLSCHPKSQLNPGTTTTWKSYDRIHNTVKGWGGMGLNANNAVHAYTCSKCHTPHSSCLPRLLITNCLDYNHRGRMASGGTVRRNTVRGSRGTGQGSYPRAGGGYGSQPNYWNNGGGAYFFGKPGTSQNTPPPFPTCHDTAPGNAGTWPSFEYWNSKSPW